MEKNRSVQHYFVTLDDGMEFDATTIKFGGIIMEYTELLKAKGFSLNSYPEGKFWEMIVTDNEDKKQHICNVFGADIELFDSNITDIDTLILQCAEDFIKCIFYYDCNPFDMESNTFMNCVKNI